MPIGGTHLTNDLSIGLRLTEGQAEKLKLRFGRALVKARDKTDKVWLDGNFAIGDRQFPRLAIEQITAARSWELLEVVRKKLGPQLFPGNLRLGGRPDRRHGQAAGHRRMRRQGLRNCRRTWARRRDGWPRICASRATTPRSACSTTGSAPTSRGPTQRRRGGFLRNVTRLFASS